MEITYQKATLKDLQAMIKVGDDLFDNPIKPARAEEFINDPRHHLILAYLGDDIVGMVSAFHYVHPDKDPALFINEAGVVDEHQNKGIGRTLIKEMLELGRQLGCTEAWVATEDSNIAAQKAYIAAGGQKDDEPAVVFEYEL